MNDQTRTDIATALRTAAAILSASETLSQLYAESGKPVGERFYKYNRDFDGDQHYFMPREKLKNGGFRGLTVVVTPRGRLPKKAKVDVVDTYTAANFNLISREELDPDVLARFAEAG